jgi:hypothetical protein
MRMERNRNKQERSKKRKIVILPNQPNERGEEIVYFKFF